MNDDNSWDRIVDAIDARFGLQKHGRLERHIEDHLDLTEKVAFIEFDRNGTNYRLERVTGPAVIDKKAVGGRRIGATLRYETVYDPHEIVHRTDFFRDEHGNWTKIDPSELAL